MADRIRVLHVDDDPEARSVTADYLEQTNEQIDVTSVTTPKEALERLQKARIDCILTDYRMPDMDGLEFLSNVRDRWPELPCIFYTGKGSEEVASKAISEGVTSYVQKAGTTQEYERLAQQIVAATEQRRADEYERIAGLVRDVQADLVRARTREEIETNVCERLVDADPYSFAWIGTVDAHRNRVTPRAAAGLQGEPFEISVDERDTGQAPTEKAVSTRSVAVVRDTAENASYDQWHENALDQTYRSAAAVPIEYDGTLYGVLNVYADHPRAFDSDEQSLLRDLSETTAHAYYRVQAQKRYESQYQELFENAPVMMAFTSEENGEPIIEDCNQRFAETLGYSSENLEGRPIAELYTDSSAHAFLDGEYERALGGELSTREREFVTAEGDRVVTIHQATPRRDDTGEVTGTNELYVEITQRAKAEEALKRAQAMESAMDGMAILDENSEYVYMNQAHADIYGYDDPETFIGRTWREFYEPDELERIEAEIVPTLEEAGQWRGEVSGLRADGTTFPQELSLTRLEDGSFVGVVRDISERKDRNQEFQKLNREFETVFENVQDSLFLLTVDADEEIRFQRLNERDEQFTGWSSEEIRGKTPVEAFGDDPGSELEANYRECLERQETVVYEEELDLGGETTVWQTKLTPIVVGGDVEQIVGSAREITELRRRERKLERAQKRLQVLFDEAPDAMVIHDRSGSILETNEKNLSNLGYEYDELTSMTVTDYEVGVDPADIRRQWAEMDLGETLEVEGEHKRKDGSTFPVEVWVSKIEIHGEIRFLALSRDITERKEREQELAETRERLSLALDAADAAVWEMDLKTEKLHWDEQSQRLWGYEPGEFTGTFEEFRRPVHPDDRDELEATYRNTIENRSGYQTEFRVCPDDRTVRWIETAAQVVTDADGEPDRLIGLSRDVTERKERGRTIRQLKERLELAVDGAELGVWDWDMTTDEVEFNEQWVHMLGHSLDEIEPHLDEWKERVHPDDLETVEDALDAHIAAETDYYETEHRMRTAHGDWMWIRDIGKIVERDADGNPIRAVGIHLDIDKRKSSEKMLEEERDMFAQGPAVVFKWRNEEGWPVEHVSENVEDVFGYSPDEFTSGELPYAEIVHDDDIDQVVREVEVNSDEDTDRFGHDPYRVITDEGDVRWVLDHTKNVRDNGEITHRQGYLVDITERKRREQELQQFQEAVEQTAHAVYITDSEGVIEYVNSAFEQITGYDGENALGQKPKLLQSGEHDEEFYRDLWETITSGERWDDVVIDERADGEQIVISQTISPITDESGEPEKFVAVAQDITQQKEYEQRLEEQRDNLEVLNKVVRHDIRNKLQLVLAYTEMLESHVGDDGAVYVDTLLEAARSAVDITTTARDVTKVMLQSDVDSNRVPIRPVLEREIENVRSNYEYGLISVDASIPAVDVRADEMLDSVFRNVLSNAVQHNDKDVPEVAISAAREDETVVIEIADNGHGVPDERKEEIFQQGEMGLDSDGTGLGLYLVDTLVDRYGGDVRVEDNDPEGAVFILELPIAEPAKN